MDLLCERCRSVIDTEPCPVCGGMEIRPPEAEDLCRLTTLDGPRTEILSGTLERAGIPFRLVSATNRYHLYRTFFVPYKHFDDAFNIDRELWRTPEPMADDLFESAPGLFTGDEIDRMEADQLDGLSRDDLNGYLDKINRTLKEIRLQEQRWKLRINRLLDMKEEAEILLEDM